MPPQLDRNWWDREVTCPPCGDTFTKFESVVHAWYRHPVEFDNIWRFGLTSGQREMFTRLLLKRMADPTARSLEPAPIARRRQLDL